MKILILNSSPRHGGLITQLLEEIKKNISSKHTVGVVNIFDLHFTQCQHCVRCQALINGTCALPSDDMHRVADLVKVADVLIVGSPCHLGNTSKVLKTFYSRIDYVMVGEKENGVPHALQKGKRAMIVSTRTSIFPFSIFSKQSHDTTKAISKVLTLSGYNIIGTIEKSDTPKHRELTAGEIKKCALLGQMI